MARIEIKMIENFVFETELAVRITNIKTGNLVILAKTGIIFFDVAENKITTTPKAFLSHFLQP